MTKETIMSADMNGVDAGEWSEWKRHFAIIPVKVDDQPAPVMFSRYYVRRRIEETENSVRWITERRAQI